jgi:hypothetical protein
MFYHEAGGGRLLQSTGDMAHIPQDRMVEKGRAMKSLSWNPELCSLVDVY